MNAICDKVTYQIHTHIKEHVKESIFMFNHIVAIKCSMHLMLAQMQINICPKTSFLDASQLIICVKFLKYGNIYFNICISFCASRYIWLGAIRSFLYEAVTPYCLGPHKVITDEYDDLRNPKHAFQSTLIA